jgi:hypothetical protein
MTNIRISFETLAKLVQREFNTEETLYVLNNPQKVFWSWGVSKIFNFDSKALLLYVQGHHHKGWVVIILAWNDTYSYYLLNYDESIKLEVHNVYFDCLQEALDKHIEFIDEYRY